MTIDLRQFRQTFFDESFEGLETMEQGLLSLDEANADDAVEIVNDVFRAAHSIKGGSGTFGFTEVTEFTHTLETLLDEVRSGERRPEPSLIQVLLDAVDALRELLDCLRDERPFDEDSVRHHRARLDAELSESAAGAALPPGAPDEVTDADGVWEVHFRPHAHLMQTGNDPLLILRHLTELGATEIALDDVRLPPFEDLDPLCVYLAWRVRLPGSVDRDEIRAAFDWVDQDCDLTIESLTVADAQVEQNQGDGSPPASPPPESRPDPEPKNTDHAAIPRSRQPRESSIRVDTEKVDALVNMVGELVITQAMLADIAENFSPDRLGELRSGIAHLSQHTRELQENVMQIRMLPVSHLFARLPRLVYDVSLKLGKRVELVTSGESTELDKGVLESIVDPLVHLVRNAVDHGIESTEARVAAGKDPAGVVALRAGHEGGTVVIEIEDDGAGLDFERIRQKAVDLGWIHASDEVSQEVLADFVFRPGFSTAAAVSDVSGRGVGMDVVKGNIERLGGTIALSSRHGQGTTVTIRLPLTLAILDGQLLRVGHQVFVLPLVAIVESIRLEPADLHPIQTGGEVYTLRNESLRVTRLREVLGIPCGSTPGDEILVVVDTGGRRLALVVDELLAQQQIVIKSLEANYAKVPGIGGATILGDGTVALILDPMGLERLGLSGFRPKAARASTNQEAIGCIRT